MTINIDSFISIAQRSIFLVCFKYCRAQDVRHIARECPWWSFNLTKPERIVLDYRLASRLFTQD